MVRFRVLTVAVVSAAAVLALSQLAAGAVGDLTPKGCISDKGTNNGCGQTTKGLAEAESVAVSPDGKSVYTAAESDSAIARFKRNPTTGALKPGGCIEDKVNGNGECGQTAHGLLNVSGVAVSPDGRSVYAVSAFDDAVVIFKRDTTTGALTPKGCIEDKQAGPGECGAHTIGLDSVRGIAVSPNGKSVYTASENDNAVVHFARNRTTGALTPKECISDTDNGDPACTHHEHGMNDSEFVTVSPDGKSVYSTSEVDNAIVRFNRDTTTGKLTAKGCIDDNDTGPDTCAQSTDGLRIATEVGVSPDGSSVYVVADGDSAIVQFARSSNGALTPAGCIDDDTGADTCATSVPRMSGAEGLAISPNGRSVYVSAFGDNAVTVFKRSLANGALTDQGCVEDSDNVSIVCANQAPALGGAFDVAISPKGDSVYTTAFNDDAITRFNRQH